MFPATLQIVGYPEKESTHAIYVAKEIKEMFISRGCLLDLGCLPATWPYPAWKTETCAAADEDNLAPCGCPVRSITPTPPTSPPFTIVETDECRERL